LKGEISFENVDFSYPSKPDIKVLNGFTFKIEAGKSIGLVGPSGAGKSTIIQMVERFYDPQTGVVKLDGKNLKSYNLTSLR
jgi:ATP-binding cassette subfamily B (MDR/TAP) protein 1